MDQKKLKIAYHETGHAVMALISRHGIQNISLKEMDSPRGTDKYLGFTKLEPFEQKIKYTVEDAIRRIMISLGGYASEVLFSGGSCNVGGDDLSTAVKWAEYTLQVEEFRNLAARLLIPDPGVLDMIENPKFRAYIDYWMRQCIEQLAPYRPVIKLIAEKLYEREELTEDEVSDIFNSFIQSSPSVDQMNRPSLIL